MSYHLIELCCGSAALTVHLLGGRRALLPYQGSKWRYRRELEALLGELGFKGPPMAISLVDAGPWGGVWGLLGRPEERAAVVRILKELDQEDPHTVYKRLISSTARKPWTIDLAMWAAEFLFLQRLAFGGKAVSVNADGLWRSPGFNKTSAYGTPATERFGAVRPMVRSLIEAVEALPEWPANFGAAQADVTGVSLSGLVDFPRVVYIDPPYQGTTRYPGCTLPREEVIRIALDAQTVSAVLVSEAEPIEGLVARGWKKHRLGVPKCGASPQQTTRQEWVTYCGRGS